MDDLSQYQDLYIQTSKEYIQSLNTALLKLEKDQTDKEAIEEIFRSAHSLKSQSAAMGFQSTGYLCHAIEDVFYEIKEGRMRLTSPLADELFSSLDGLSSSLAAIEKDSQEIDLTSRIETLKKVSGVTTEGAGKSVHTQGAEVPPTQPLAPAAGEAPGAQPVDSLGPTSSPAGHQVTTIAVKVTILDEIMNSLESLLIEQLRLHSVSANLADEHEGLQEYLHTSDRILNDLEYQIMSARAVPVALVFDQLPRAVRDVARAENKQVELIINGEDLELDRTVIDKLSEPLIHLLRNAISHGIAQKGTVTVRAERLNDYAQIVVADDGQGIDWEGLAQKANKKLDELDAKARRELLFSGVSTSQEVTQISGRGVGLKAIKKMIDMVGGKIEVSSEAGKGTTFTIRLPLTLAIVKALLVKVQGKEYAIPVADIQNLVTIQSTSLRKMADQLACIVNDEELPLVPLASKLLSQEDMPLPDHELLAVVVGEHEARMGLIVDGVGEASNIVIKPIPKIFGGVKGFSGVTILSSGKTALVLNIGELV